MKLRLAVSIQIVAGLLQAHAGAAQIIVVGQDRRASASTFVSAGGDFDQQQFSEVAPGAGPFDVSLQADSALPGGNASASATQVSFLASGSLGAEGTVTGHAESTAEDATAYGASQSNIAIRFTLTNPAAFSLVGFLEGANTGTVTVQLSHPFETIAWYSASDERLDLGQTGTLPGDTYDLNITSSAVGSAFPPGGVEQGSGSYDVRLILGQATDVPVVSSLGVRAFPNPFRESTRLVIPADVREVRILDPRGRLVRTLAASAFVLFDGRDLSGRPLASGVYWVKPIGAQEHEAVKLVRLR